MDPLREISNRTNLGYLNPIIFKYNPLHGTIISDQFGRCMFRDEDFQIIYIKKWSKELENKIVSYFLLSKSISYF
ncbi:hypothetical protein DMZ48_13225 [Robertkochia solimangrovi]|nr:hypothetical protein DMZ48_13225 [Robertkochia solimangrovi]